MHPPGHVKKVLVGLGKKRRNEYFIANILGIFSFLIFGFLIAPYFHEFLHMLVFELQNCYYTSHIAIDESMRVYGSLKPFCDLSVRQSVILLGAGVFGNLAVACALFFLSWKVGKMGKLPLSNFLLLTTWGFLLDPLFYLFARKGDIINILRLIERGDLIQFLPALGLIMFSFFMSYTYMHLKHSFGDYKRIMQELKDCRSFLDQIGPGKRGV